MRRLDGISHLTMKVSIQRRYSTKTIREALRYKSCLGRTRCLERPRCRFCGSSDVVKFGFNSTKSSRKQRYLCKRCLATFTPTSELVKGNRFDEKGAEDVQHLKLEGLGNFRRLVEQIVHRPLDFELYPQAVYSTETFLDLLTHIATTHDFVESGSMTFKLLRGEGPSADDLLWHVGGFDEAEVRQKFNEAFDRILTRAQPFGFSRRKMFDVAIDVHDWLWYGKPVERALKTKPKRGTSRAFKFISISVLRGGFRFVLFALPVEKQRDFVGKVEELLRFTLQWVKIRRVYLDGEFYQVRMVRLLKKLGLRFVIRASISSKRLKERVKRAKPPALIQHTMWSKAGKERVNLLVVWGRRELKGEKTGHPRRKKQCFLTNLEITEEGVERLAEDFGKRWGIETSYRVMKDFRPRTASPNYVVRFFLFMFSVCLHNCWVLANLFVGETVLRFVPNKPFITAKMFCVMLYLPGLPFNPG